MTYPLVFSIGLFTGTGLMMDVSYKDHATVLHAVKNIFECWYFCMKNSTDDKKNINIYNKIFQRLQTDLENIKKKEVHPIDYKAEAFYWKRKYYCKFD